MIESKTRCKFVELGGSFCRKVGLPRSLGQIYGLLFLSERPIALEEIAQALGLSKASVSVGTRQLVAWGAIRQVWIRGERRDHYEVVPELAEVIRRGYTEFIKPKLEASDRRYALLMDMLDEDLEAGAVDRKTHDICVERLKELARLQRTMQSAAPLMEQWL